MKRHVNIPIFIPHLGCPNQCVFCNQRTISGVEKFDISNVKKEIDQALKTIDTSQDVEIAFFGGSFTGIDRNLMISLLEVAYEYVVMGKVTSIRCSTRPDYIDNEVLDILEKYGVRTIELGLQSTSDEVLMLTKRGHTYEDEERACRLIIERGFDLVGQMMIGLPGSTLSKEISTAEYIVKAGACAARIYPTVVFYDTELCYLAESGEYKPITIEDAIERSARVLRVFIENNVEVIRIGLCAADNLTDEEKYYAGPNHPALGEMIEGELYYKKILDLLDSDTNHCDSLITIFVPKGCLSKAIGQNKRNKNRLIEKYKFKNVKFKEDENLSDYELRIEEERKRKCI